MAHDVFVVETDERDAFDVADDLHRLDQAGRRPVGRSICVMSPVTTAFEPKPSRVRNIFICSDVVFCASSRMTNASFSVRPRMNAIGATSIDAALEQPLRALDLQHVVKRVVERAQVRVDLLLQIARQEAELLARLDRRPREDDAVDPLGQQERHGLRHREVRLARAGGADAEDDVVLLDGLEVPPLVDGSSGITWRLPEVRGVPSQEVIGQLRRSRPASDELRRPSSRPLLPACSHRVSGR